MAAWQHQEQFAVWLGIIIVLFLGLFMVFVTFTRLYFARIIREEKKLQVALLAHQKQLLEDSILVQERERTRIAADLHDALISKLNVSLLTLTTTADLAKTRLLLQNSITIARQISHDLSPPMVESCSIMELMNIFISPLKSIHQVNFYAQTYVGDFPLETPMKLQLFRIFQEVINNILKHANANQIDIVLRKTTHYFALSISDNGVGLSVKKQKGLGLKNIALRISLLNGVFNFNSNIGQGTRFFCIIPLQAVNK